MLFLLVKAGGGLPDTSRVSGDDGEASNPSTLWLLKCELVFGVLSELEGRYL